MKRNWILTRQFVEQQDGQRRWDKAYQMLIQMTTIPNEDTVRGPAEVVFQEKNSGEFL